MKYWTLLCVITLTLNCSAQIIKSKDSRSELSSLKTNMDFDPSKDFKDFNS